MIVEMSYSRYWPPTRAIERLAAFDRTRLSTKLFLILGLFLLPLAVGMGELARAKGALIDFTRRELEGVATIRSLGALVVTLNRRPIPVSEVKSAITTMRSLVIEAPFASANSRDAVGRLARDGADYELASKWSRKLFRNLSDDANLTLDPELDSYYLMDVVTTQLPRLIAQLSSLRDLQSTNDGSSIETLREIIAHLDRSDEIRTTIREDIASMAGSGRSLSSQKIFMGSYASLEKNLDSNWSAITELPSAPTANDRYEVLLKSINSVWVQGFDSLAKLLDARIRRLDNELVESILLTGAVFSTVVGLTIILLGRITKPLRKLGDTARAITLTGDMNLRVDWVARDDVGELITRFNTLMDELARHRDLREAHARTEAAYADLRMR